MGGIFTDLKVPAQPGLSARIDIDTRFITAPTAIKKLGMAAGALAVLVAIIALSVLDRHSRGRTLVNWRSRSAGYPDTDRRGIGRAGGSARPLG